MSNPFEAIESRLSRIENLLLDIKSPVKEPEKKLLSVAECAVFANVSELSIRNYIADGKIRAVRLGRRILIDQSQFESLEEVKSLKYKR
jgi:excisionase family DNA binding protein